MRISQSSLSVIAIVIVCSLTTNAQAQVQAMDENGSPVFQVDPFWPGPLPNRWGMQQVTGFNVELEDFICFLYMPIGA